MQWYESELEEFVTRNPFNLFETLYLSYPEQKLEIGILGRQVPCLHGIIDLIWYATLAETNNPFFRIHITEFKAVKADERTVSQVLRYMEAAKEVNFYDVVDGKDYLNYAQYIDAYYEFVPVIVAPDFDPRIDWFPNRIIATKTPDGFDLASAGSVRKDSTLNTPLKTCLWPIALRAERLARARFMAEQTQDDFDSEQD